MKTKIEHWNGWEIRNFPKPEAPNPSRRQLRHIECRHPDMPGIVITFWPDYVDKHGMKLPRSINFGNNNHSTRLWFNNFDAINLVIKYMEIWLPDVWWEAD